MIKSCVLSLAILLFIPSLVLAQRSSASSIANKSWPTFWRQFSAAVNKKDRVALKQLMSSEDKFFAGGGGETRDQWIQMIDNRKGWRELQRSVAAGTVSDNEGRRLTRITRDKGLVFEFIGGRWRFVGVMGD